MYQYWLYRSVNNLNTFQIRETVNHPDSTIVDTDNIQPGNLYAYRLLAVDSAGNMSEFSDTVAIGVPKIDWQQPWILNGRRTTIPLSDFLYDPDHATNVLNLTVSNQTNVIVEINGENLEITPDPFYHAGLASFDLEATDPTEFWDSDSIQFVFLQTAPSGIEPIDDKIPSDFQLFQNYPNPFNPNTWIQFAVPRTSNVEIAIFNILGEKIDILFYDQVSPGYYGLSFNAAHLSSGTYFLMLNSDKTTLVKRILLIK
jgi:hypothetical protein